MVPGLRCYFQKNKGLIRQLLAGLTVSWTAFLNGVYLGWPSPLMEILSKPNGAFTGSPSERELELMVAALDMGTIFSPIPCCYLIDKFGRRPLLILVGPMSLIGWLLAYFWGSMTSLYAVRLIQGLQCGIANTIVPLYISEMAEPRIRGTLNTIPGAALNVGVLYGYIIGLFGSYDALTALCVIATVPYVIAVLFIPETPYFHLMRGEEDKARAILDSTRDGLDELEFAEMKRSVAEEMQQNLETSLLTSPTDLRSLFTVLFTYVGATFTYFWVIPEYAALTIGRGTQDKIMSTNQFAVLLGLITLAGTVPAAYLVDRMGRKPLLMLSCALTALFAFAAAVYFYVREKDLADTSGWGFCICLFVSGLLCSASLGLGQMPFILQSEYFPASSRAIAGAIVSGVGAVFSVISALLYPDTAKSVGMYFNYVISGVVASLVFVYCHFEMLETRGLTFAEIQRRFVARAEGIALSEAEEDECAMKLPPFKSDATHTKKNLSAC
ncbi:probable metabolite transport protein CsbC isoform X4 [Bemisia tabaci]|nr:PREDICTED: probable metabolite transport protein CsbC isoform X4 [Bemisia tabaci]